MDEKRSGKAKGGDPSSKSTGSYLGTVLVHVEKLNFAKYLLSVNVVSGKMICKMLPCWSSHNTVNRTVSTSTLRYDTIRFYWFLEVWWTF